MDNYTKIEKAKNLVTVEENDPKYGTQLFIALRSTKVELKEAIQIIISLHLSVDFQKYFASCIDENDDPRLEEFVEMGEEIIEEIKETTKLPSSNLLNMVWIEGIRFYKRDGKRKEGATNTDGLMRNIKEIKSKLFNVRSG